MRRIRISGLCVMVAVAIATIGVASASASAPELGRCIKVVKGKGKYKDAGCEKGEVKEGGTYEWIPASPETIKNKFTSAEGLSTFETVAGVKVVCKADTDTGEYTNAKEDLETIVFTGCETSGIPCQSAGAAAGEIRTPVLRSVLGFIKAPLQVGVSLESVTGAPFAQFECGGIPVSITGAVIAPITPISKMTLTFKEKFKQLKGKQKPEKFEGAPKDTLTGTFGGKAEPVGFTSEDTVTNEEKLEINEVL